MIVFRNNQDETIGASDSRGELTVLKRFAGVIHSDGNFPDVDQFRFDIAAF
jgi:hypothetical protein